MHKVAILDAGAQYAKVIDRRVRELNVYSEILPLDSKVEDLAGFDAVIISGGPSSVYDKKAPAFDPKLFSLKKPILGICYGMQLMNHALGGSVKPLGVKEYGETIIRVKPHLLFSSLSKKEQVLMSHGDSITRLAPGFKSIANSSSIIAAIADDSRQYYGLQFHPEVDLTAKGIQVLKNFLFTISNLKPSYKMEDRIQAAVDEIRSTVGSRPVLSLISGGVDSAVSTALLLNALPKEKVYAIHVDSGLMRKDESSKVCSALAFLGLKHLRLVNAKKDFLAALKGVSDPQQKREIIGNLFMHIVDSEIKKLKLKDCFLAQGTLRPDLIESASGLVSKKAQVIKTHHNDTSLVREKRRKGLVIETNKDWHKDEVRLVGRKLGLPAEIVERHPFPGPGLGVRILCAEHPYLNDIEEVQSAVDKIVKPHYLKAAVLPIRSVGVQGDGRSYKYAVALSGRGHFPTLKRLAFEIPKLVPHVNRVVYLFERNIVHPPRSITPTYIDKNVADLLREADSIINRALLKYDVKVAQCPVVLVPVSFSGKNYSVALRPFITNDFMTGRPASFGEVPIACLKEIVRNLHMLDLDVLYDLTSKPPATTEWE